MRLSKLLLIALAPAVLVPSFAFAEGSDSFRGRPLPASSPWPSSTPMYRDLRTPEPVESDAPRFQIEAAKFCTNLSNVTNPLSSSLSSRYGQFSTNLTERSAAITDQYDQLKQRLATERDTADQTLHTDFVDLSAKAQNSTQAAAITAFETAVQQAVSTRRAAVDAADQAFFQGLQAAQSSRQQQLSAAAAAYKAAVAAALATAQASCASGTSPQAVRSALRTALQTAHTTLMTAVQNAQKLGPNVQALQATRKAAVDAANAAFHTAIQQAIATLKAALGAAGTATSPSPSPSVSTSPSPSATP